MTDTLVHTSQGDWDNVTPGIWYGFLAIERPDGETDYVYGYSNANEYDPDPDELCPEGCKILSRVLLLTSKGKWLMYSFGHRWAFEAQLALADDDTYVMQSYDEYEDAL